VFLQTVPGLVLEVITGAAGPWHC